MAPIRNLEELQAIVFDLFETVVTLYDPNWDARQSVAERLGVDPIAFAKAWKATREDRWSGAIADYQTALSLTLRSLGRDLDEPLATSLDQERVAVHRRAFSQVDPRVATMLAQLRKLPLRIGLLSNTSAEEVVGWWDCTLPPFFDDVVFSYEIGLIKPDRRIYELACHRLGVAPQAVMFVGDGANEELQGADAFGLHVYWATWFVEQYPAWEELAQRRGATRYPRLEHPANVVTLASEGVASHLPEKLERTDYTE